MKGLVLIYIITAIGALGALRAPLLGLFVYVAFAVLRPAAIWGWAGDMENLSWIVGAAMFAGWIFRGFGSKKFGRAWSIVAALLGFAAWSVLSSAQAMDFDQSWVALVAMAKFVMPFLVGVTMLDTEELSRRMLWVIVLAQGYVGFEMNLSYLTGYNRASEGFAGMDNNCFGVALVSTIGPAIALAIVSKKWWEKALAGVSAALIVHTTLLTFSRGAMLGMIVVGVVGFFVMPKRPKYVLMLALIAAVTVRYVGPQLLARYSTVLVESDDRDESSESRLDLWRDCLKIVADRPIFGVGPANFPVVAANFGWTEGKEAHSIWFQTAAEVGVPGVLALILFYGIAVVKLWPIARQKITDDNQYRVSVATGIIMSIAGFAVAGQFVTLVGLEIPYYVTMIGVVLLKAEPVVRAEPSTARQLTTRPHLVGPNRATAPIGRPGIVHHV